MEPSQRAVYVDEADRFYADPVGFIRREYAGLSAPSRYRPPWQSPSSLPFATPKMPDCLVFFEQLEKSMPEIVRQIDEMSGQPKAQEWVPEWRGFNSEFHDDWRRKGKVVVWCLRDNPKS
jgi:phosphatidylinositol glycan class B